MHKILLKIFQTGRLTEPVPESVGTPLDRGAPGKGSLFVRHVDAGSCNACELELHALTQSVYAPESLGIQFVASPRHADLLLATGPVTTAMKEALKETFQAMPEPRLVLAVGDCACHGGPFQGSYGVVGGVEPVLQADAKIPGCPPGPKEILAVLARIASRGTPG